VRDLDLSAATGPLRELTQAIAREHYLHGDTHAIDYPSRYGETIRPVRSASWGAPKTPLRAPPRRREPWPTRSKLLSAHSASDVRATRTSSPLWVPGGSQPSASRRA
jgi:hypothetical protein